MYIQNVSPVFYNYNPLISYINQLIDFGYSNFNSLLQHDQNKIMVIIMDSLGCDQSYAIFDNDDFSKNCDYIKNFYLSGNLNDAYRFAKALKLSTFKKYQDQIDLIMDHLKNQRRAA